MMDSTYIQAALIKNLTNSNVVLYLLDTEWLLLAVSSTLPYAGRARKGKVRLSPRHSHNSDYFLTINELNLKALMDLSLI